MIYRLLALIIVQLISANWHHPGGQSGLSDQTAYAHLLAGLTQPTLGNSLFIHFCLQSSNDTFGHPSQSPVAVYLGTQFFPGYA